MKEPHLALAPTILSPTANDYIRPKAALPTFQCRDVYHHPTLEATAGAAGLKVYAGGGTHISPSLLCLQALLRKCLTLIIQPAPLLSPRWKTHLSLISSRPHSYGIRTQACRGFTSPSEYLGTPGVYKTGAGKFSEKNVFSFQPDKRSHRTELGEPASGVVEASGTANLTETLVWKLKHISTSLDFRYIRIVIIVVVFPCWCIWIQC